MTRAKAAEIAEEIVAAYYDRPSLETREEHVEAMTDLILAALVQSGDVEKPEPAAPGLITDHEYERSAGWPFAVKSAGCGYYQGGKPMLPSSYCGQPRAAHTQESGQ